MASNKEYQMAIKIAGEIEKSFYNSTNLTKKELKNIAKAASQASSATKYSLSKNLEEAAPAFQGLEKVGTAAFSAIKKAATVAATAVGAVATASFVAGSNFEEQMSTVQAISMSSVQDMELLSKKAKELGRTTKFSATEVGQGYEYMAMAGWKTEDMLAGIEGILNLAAASGEDLGLVSDIVTDAMTAFGLGAEEVNRFADVLAAASNSSNTDVAMMGETFKYVAPVAGSFGYTIEDVAVAIGLMANSGIKAEMAGTALRSLLKRLVAPTKQAQEAIDTLGISLTDRTGEMKPFAEIVKDLREAFSGLSETETGRLASMLAGSTGMSGLLAILNASESDFNNLTQAIENSTGAAEKMSQIRLDNLKGDITILKSAAEGFGIEFYENLSAPIRGIVQDATNSIDEMTESFSKKFPTARREVKQFASSMWEMADPLLDVGKWLLDNPEVIVGTIAGIGTAIYTYKAATGVMALATSLGALGPAGWTILGIGGVVGILTGIGISIKKSANEAKKANLDRHFGDIALTLEELQDVAGKIVGSGDLDKIRESLAAMEDLEGIQKEIEDTTEAINKANWKVAVGIDLTKEEQESYKTDLEEFVKQTQEYVTQRQYAVNLAVGVLTDDDLEGSNIVDQINEFYQNKQDELSDLGTKLNKTITDAFTDGLLDVDEMKEISELQRQMAKIQSEMAQSEFEANMDLLGVKYAGKELDADSFKNLQAEIQEQVTAATEDYDKAYTLAMANAKVMLKDGDIDAEGYAAMTQEFEENYLEQISRMQEKAAAFQTDTIQQAYKDVDFSGLSEELIAETEKELGRVLDSVAYEGAMDQHLDFLASDMLELMSGKISTDTKNALADLYEQLEPAFEEMISTREKYKEAGEVIPKELENGIHEMATIGALSGNLDAMWELIRESAESPEYQDAIQRIHDAGGYMPEEIASAIEQNQGKINGAVLNSYAMTSRIWHDTFGKGFGKAPLPNGMRQAPLADVETGHADGGIFTVPHVAWFAEAGPEAAIPLDGSQNAINLWKKTGELLGMPGIASESETIDEFIGTPQISYNPILQFYGEAPSKEDVESALEDSQEKFARMMEQWIKNNGRFKFA